jgi:hypothetical protein
MKHYNLIIPFLGILFCLSPRDLAAQSPRPEPGSAIVPSQNEETSPLEAEGSEESGTPEEEKDEKKPKGKIRVCLGGSNTEMRFAIGIMKAGQKIPDSQEESMEGFEWLYRGIRSGSIRDYLEVPVGNYDLVILPEEVEKFTGSDDEFKPPTWKKAKKIERESIRITPKSHFTAMVRILEDDFKVDVFDDKNESSGSKVLRVFNLTDGTTGGLKTLVAGKETIIFRSFPEFFSKYTLPPSPSTVAMELYVPGSKPKSMVRKFYEADFGKNGSCSLVVLKDRYGRTTAAIMKDGS